ncbi:hypothetical protein ABDD95_03225 [Mucilaginibacter sp. PAMB04274]|uniref:hypothetical protein n=1 Tax=Mucilaginibacter sp. PAMB04274 TaxID=3138568 RepID=UPI0031F63751
MRTLVKVLATIIIITVSCKKELNYNVLTGKWRLAEVTLSTGGFPTTKAVDKSNNNYVHFKSSGDFESNSLTEYTRYEVKDDLIILYKRDNSSFTYAYRLNNQMLYLSPRTVMCIEGCSDSYKKVAD